MDPPLRESAARLTRGRRLSCSFDQRDYMPPRSTCAKILVIFGTTLVMTVLMNHGAPVHAHETTFSSSTTASFHDWDYSSSDMEGTGGGEIADGPDLFHGQVNSEQEECVGERLVRIFRVVGGPRQPDEWVDKWWSQEDGSWMAFHEDPGSGTYYARVRAKDIGTGRHDHVCARGRSPNFRITDAQV